MKKYCKNCEYYKQDTYYGGYVHDLCTYNLNWNPYDTPIERRYKMTNPIPAIHNANNNCKYYKEEWLYKLLRRIKNDKSNGTESE